jgi:hypothetical protein
MMARVTTVGQLRELVREGWVLVGCEWISARGLSHVSFELHREREVRPVAPAAVRRLMNRGDVVVTPATAGGVWSFVLVAAR